LDKSVDKLFLMWYHNGKGGENMADTYRPSVPKKLYERIKIEADKKGRRVQDVVVAILTEWIDRNEGKDKWKM